MSVFTVLPADYWMDWFCGLCVEDYLNRIITASAMTPVNIDITNDVSNDGSNNAVIVNNNNLNNNTMVTTTGGTARLRRIGEEINLHLVNRAFYEAYLERKGQFFSTIYSNIGTLPPPTPGMAQPMCVQLSKLADDFFIGYSKGEYPSCTYETFRYIYVNFIYRKALAEVAHHILNNKKADHQQLYTLNYGVLTKKDPQSSYRWMYRTLNEDIFPLCFKQTTDLLDTHELFELTFLSASLTQVASTEGITPEQQEKECHRVVYRHFANFVKKVSVFLDRVYIRMDNLTTLDEISETVFETEYAHKLAIEAGV